MKYYNWQKIHKEAYTAKPKKATIIQNDITETGAAANQLTPLEVIHQRAWDALKIYCRGDELDSLQKLANQYDRGDRLPDTCHR